MKKNKKIENEMENDIYLVAIQTVDFVDELENGLSFKLHLRYGDVIKKPRIINNILKSSLRNKFEVIECPRTC